MRQKRIDLANEIFSIYRINLEAGIQVTPEFVNAYATSSRNLADAKIDNLNEYGLEECDIEKEHRDRLLDLKRHISDDFDNQRSLLDELIDFYLLDSEIKLNVLQCK